MKTNEEYLQRYAHCPHCDSDQIEGEAIDVNENYAYQEVACLDCRAGWSDVYKLTAFTPTFGPEKVKDKS
jgi:hypothetical protein